MCAVAADAVRDDVDVLMVAMMMMVVNFEKLLVPHKLWQKEETKGEERKNQTKTYE